LSVARDVYLGWRFDHPRVCMGMAVDESMRGEKVVGLLRRFESLHRAPWRTMRGLRHDIRCFVAP
jgi:hypothetical protein